MNLRPFDGDEATIDFLDLLMIDIHGGIRHVSVPSGYVSDQMKAEGIGFDASNLGFAKTSDSDMVAIPDMATAFVREHDGRRILHVLCDVELTEGGSFAQYPRNVTRRTVEHLRAEGIADDAQMLVELEFHVFDDVRYGSGLAHAAYQVHSAEGLGPGFDELPRFGPQEGYHRIVPQDRYEAVRHDVVQALTAIGIPVKYHHHEVSAAQLEIELDLIPLARAADAVALAKWLIRSVVAEHGLFVTFMPKPLYGAAGNGMHVHQYLERDGRTLFAGEALFGLTDVALAYTAGLLEHSLSGSLLAFTNPSTNSYRRLVPGFEAPVGATFARASREASVRVPGYLKPAERRIEYRTGDASSNPHYALSAMVLAGADGIRRGADPVALGFDDPRNGKVFPLSLLATIDGLARDHGYLLPAFPSSLIELWIRLKRQEAERVYRAPTPQEYELYFNV
jgi:glutamine synthetase